MGKRLEQQRRGRGSPTWKAAIHREKVPVRYRVDYDKLVRGEVVDIRDDSRYSVPVARVLLENGEYQEILAPEGIYVGAQIEMGKGARIELGNVLPLGEIPEGVPIFNIEGLPGDGGKFVRTAGSYALIVSKKGDEVVVRMPSRKLRVFDAKCLATLGIAAAGGIKEKPLLKAGKMYHKRRAMGRKYPDVRGVHMSAYDHPFGGKEHHPGKPTTTSKHAPPGRKVGHIGARRTGRKRGRRKVVA